MESTDKTLEIHQIQQPSQKQEISETPETSEQTEPSIIESLHEITESLLKSTKTHAERFACLNHIYGCFVLLESLTDPTVHLTVDNIILSANEKYNVYDNFTTFGQKHGFSKSDVLVLPQAFADYKIGPDSSTYRDVWLDVFEYVVIEGRKTEHIDAIEDDIFTLLDTYCADEKFIFYEASETGELTEESIEKMNTMVNGITTQTETLPQNGQQSSSPIPTPTPPNAPDARTVSATPALARKNRRFTRRLHGRRSLTPMHRHRSYSRTVRKHVNVIREPASM